MISLLTIFTLHRFLSIKRYREDKKHRFLIVLLSIALVLKLLTFVLSTIATVGHRYEFNNKVLAISDTIMYVLLLASGWLFVFILFWYHHDLVYRAVRQKRGDVYLVAIKRYNQQEYFRLKIRNLMEGKR